MHEVVKDPDNFEKNYKNPDTFGLPFTNPTNLAVLISLWFAARLLSAAHGRTNSKSSIYLRKVSSAYSMK